ncbi:alpha-D-ribose 1-methylphosphonate 5-triphosphate diphosphatase [Chelatococcus asaccharovorans]|uniref:Alpha-D-ribose 1-methylphosphonate 5-triphosphate diphosphatase n=1 Tax=Chelatococcus asaccharovorans TaxID=28210 RepID=A0A2V3U8R2_9HYPH|nr:alpha-D-ribose 1-methylphosphonate 5-triphosphate diphosphatase [Chelatococcus asaccharovorans]MBS7705695.1 alpha-D-ribose 1-methylphosphonate 5-triphosphate diphosphatase [Chelatococcus asaccharovorans]PXW58714.1 alpha-D-ribose 1-methylphosphonate 5-triphosphate diphosphatase [Chelatococcus asaccharovorans]
MSIPLWGKAGLSRLTEDASVTIGSDAESPPEYVLRNARVVLENEVLSGTVLVRDGLIADVATTTSLSASVDLNGDFLLPGMIDLHTDNLEKHLKPRPGVKWPDSLAALIQHDRQLISAGITTVLDSIALGEYQLGPARRELVAASADAIDRGTRRGLLRADHYIHARCELADRGLSRLLPEVADHARLRLISLMDHTPGQRQWRNLENYRRHRQMKVSDAEFADHVAELVSVQARFSPSHLRLALELAGRRSLPLASHDDTTSDDVETGAANGVGISEFPTTIEAARQANRHGMLTVGGAPNVVLGGSHSGNVSVADLARQELLDILASDYVPSSMLAAVFRLSEQGIPLWKVVAMATVMPARAIGFVDRGSIAPGKRADLVRVGLRDNTPVVESVWCAGVQVH